MEVAPNFSLALTLTVLASLSTGIGGAIIYFIRKPNTVFLSFFLGFSSGVMIYVSFVELLPQGLHVLGPPLGVLAFFLGIIGTGLFDLLIPEFENPHHYQELSSTSPKLKGAKDGANKKLMRTGLFTALVIAIHNFPEGFAVFGAALGNVKLGVMIAIAIAIHNVPEGILVSVPLFYATGNRKKAFLYSFLSGLAEPLGAVIGFFLLKPFISNELLSFVLALIAGIMVYISFDEILPTAHHYGHGHATIIGTVLGMLVIAVSLILF